MYTFENEKLFINENKIKEIINEVGDTKIVAATKYITPEKIKDLYDLGIKDFGENRVDSFIRKKFVNRDLSCQWHFIGHLQRNKAKDIINDIDYLHSLDSLELCKVIDKYRTTPLDCFVEIKMIKDSNKNGVLIDELDSFIDEASKYKNINIIGLMAMTEPEMTNDEKKNLFQIVHNKGITLNLKNFSMGMSDDYKEAIESGSTHIRLGRILYKE